MGIHSVTLAGTSSRDGMDESALLHLESLHRLGVAVFVVWEPLSTAHKDRFTLQLRASFVTCRESCCFWQIGSFPLHHSFPLICSADHGLDRTCMFRRPHQKVQRVFSSFPDDAYQRQSSFLHLRMTFSPGPVIIIHGSTHAEPSPTIRTRQESMESQVLPPPP